MLVKKMIEFQKSDLLQNLKEVDEMLTLSLSAITYFYRDTDLHLLSQNKMIHFDRFWDLKDLAEELKNDEKKAVKLDHFTWIITKFLLREPYTILDEYCKRNNLKTLLTEQEWSNFARIIRNFVTHSFLDLTQYKKHEFPVRWKNYEITWDEIERSRINISKFGNKMPLELFDKIKQFANSCPEVDTKN